MSRQVSAFQSNNLQSLLDQQASVISNASDRFRASGNIEDLRRLHEAIDAVNDRDTVAISGNRPGLVPEAFHYLARLTASFVAQPSSVRANGLFIITYEYLSDDDMQEFLSAFDSYVSDPTTLGSFPTISIRGSAGFTWKGMDAFFAPIFAASEDSVALNFLVLSEINFFPEDNRRTAAFFGALYDVYTVEKVHFHSCDFSGPAIQGLWNAIENFADKEPRDLKDTYILCHNGSEVRFL
eukprot:CAMPEP_0171494868 /NCGR_PEP_ID=MMETSP0958-20121227/5800_1 /TAXON_ID=87120 /ORGANISM="Aurantiochytrium limacinum, Strain ATCCMYA-1381" /LENGTH=238 /DNA_ID=CAMNT_0012028737 /DNA_START=119 /DNA_END=831 /DNA_ORIENTATION=-